MHGMTIARLPSMARRTAYVICFLGSFFLAMLVTVLMVKVISTRASTTTRSVDHEDDREQALLPTVEC